jgi:hypothetical protein
MFKFTSPTGGDSRKVLPTEYSPEHSTNCATGTPPISHKLIIFFLSKQTNVLEKFFYLQS